MKETLSSSGPLKAADGDEMLYIIIRVPLTIKIGIIKYILNPIIHQQRAGILLKNKKK